MNIKITVLILIAVASQSLSSSCSTSTTMSTIDLITMKQLLAEQSKTIISDMKAQVKTEVTEQLAPHAVRLDLLHDDQAVMKKQISELTSQLQQKAPAFPTYPIKPIAPVPTTHAPCTAAQLHTLPSLHLSPTDLSPTDLNTIQQARCTLNFSPITNDDLIRMKINETEVVSIEELLKRALKEYLDVNMSIPTSTISRMEIRNILHHQEIDFQTVTVEFSNMCPVNTIFKYVKNLSPEQKVSIFIPDVLSYKHENLKSQSYQLRNGPVKYKTVIKYVGNDVALYAKKPCDRSWTLVTDPSQLLQLPFDTFQKRPRENENESTGIDSSKKAKKDDDTPADTTAITDLEKTPPKSSGIPKPLFQTVPCFTNAKPSLLHTPGGGFWKPDDPRSPTPLRQDSGNC
jgi:hypothetical protein